MSNDLTIPLNIKDALNIGDLLYSMVKLKKFSPRGEQLANDIMNRISEEIPTEYHSNPNQLELELFPKS